MNWSFELPPYLGEYEPVINRFGPGYSRGRYCYRCCSSHDDHSPSLSFWLGRSRQLMFGCFAGCRKPEILKAAGLTWKDCFPPREERRPMPKIVATYDYTDEAGKLLFQTVRYHPKDFRQRRPLEGGGWAWNLDGVRRVLYRLPELIASPGRTVLLTEGEKDADTARSLGLLATTAAGGARAPWLPEYSECLSGRHVAIVPDADAPGLERACSVAGALMFHDALSIRLVSLPEKDLTAYVEQLRREGLRTHEALRQRVEAEMRSAPLWRPACCKGGGR